MGDETKPFTNSAYLTQCYPTFSGKYQEIPRVWLRQMELIFTASLTPEEVRPAMAALMLRGSAAKWWGQLDSKEPKDWEEFKKAVTKNFQRAGSDESIYERMMNLRQTGRVNEYIDKFIDLRLHLSDPQDSFIKLFFKRGCKRGVQTKIARAMERGDDCELEDIFKIARQAEANEDYLSSTPGAKKPGQFKGYASNNNSFKSSGRWKGNDQSNNNNSYNNNNSFKTDWKQNNNSVSRKPASFGKSRNFKPNNYQKSENRR
jgi:hypothetical protein